MKPGRILPLTLSICMAIAGCSSVLPEAEPVANTIGSLDLTPEPLYRDAVVAPTPAQLQKEYQAVLPMVEDEDLRANILHRIAELEMLQSEAAQEQGTELASGQRGYFDAAIEVYEQLLVSNPHSDRDADIRYQLAKAYELQGRAQDSLVLLDELAQDYPDFQYIDEVQFRRGEIFFTRGQYQQAATAYAEASLNEDGLYYAMSTYMRGWALFKIEHYPESLTAFSALLDYHLPSWVYSGEVKGSESLTHLGKGDKKLVDDTIRIMSLIFSYTDGAVAIVDLFDNIGERHYEHVLYTALGQFYLDADRFKDSADVYQAFVDSHPQHQQAPVFFVKKIDAYIWGDFPSLVLPAKQEFVEMYGINGPYWSTWPPLQQQQITPFLHDYLQELAAYQHALAQQLDMQLQQAENSDELDISEAQVVTAYRQASHWYQEFILTFADDPKVASMTFSLAESLVHGQQPQGAIMAFETVAYEFSDFNESATRNATEAGYAALLSHQAYYDTLQHLEDDNEQKQMALTASLTSQGRFVQHFATDARASEVLYGLLQKQYELAQAAPVQQRYQDAFADHADGAEGLVYSAYYDQAIANAERLLAWQPQVDSTQQLGAWLVKAHSYFTLLDYVAAESAYAQILELLALPELADEQYRIEDTREQYAASMYKQAEQALSQQDSNTAITHLLRIVEKVPDSNIRLNAQYDAASYLLEQQRWAEAIHWLTDFRQRFATHPLTPGISAKLALAYSSSEQWQHAAVEYQQIHAQSDDDELKRQALLAAARAYDKADDRDAALPLFRTYSHTYPEPFAVAMETRYRMSEFYVQSGEDSKRRFWLKKIMQADASAGEQRTDRSRSLAAMASAVFANDARVAFNRIRLSLPLNKSLKKKKAALEKALAAYTQTANYQIQEYTTEATFQIGEIYARLANDLMDSARPDELNALELEQYEILLEEQALPFEDQAIAVHETNTRRSWQGVYDQWVADSFVALRRLLPGRYNKVERQTEEQHGIY